MSVQHHDQKPDPASAWRHARRSLRRLFDDLADLQEAGGAESVADSEYWSERRVARVIGEMNLVRRMLRVEVSRLQNEPTRTDGDFSWS